MLFSESNSQLFSKLCTLSKHSVYFVEKIPNLFGVLGADFKNNHTTKQLNNFIWTNRKVELKLYMLPIGPNRFVLFSCLIF